MLLSELLYRRVIFPDINVVFLQFECTQHSRQSSAMITNW